MSTPDPFTSEGPAVTGMEHVVAALKGLQFGQVTIVVQDGVIVRIDRTERLRPEGQRRSRSDRSTGPPDDDHAA